MKLSEQERASNKAAFLAMNLPQKAEYIFAYYKLPLVLLLIVVVAFGSAVKYFLTHKEPVLYTAYVNVVPNDEADQTLTAGFVTSVGENPRKSEVVCYRELYLSGKAGPDEQQYAYASRLKVLASIDSEQLDVVLMNQESYDMLSASGFLLDLSNTEVADEAFLAATSTSLATNTIVISDNKVEVEMGQADEYEADTYEAQNALDVTHASVLAALAPEGPFYLGVIANTPRLDVALAYMAYFTKA